MEESTLKKSARIFRRSWLWACAWVVLVGLWPLGGYSRPACDCDCLTEPTCIGAPPTVCAWVSMNCDPVGSYDLYQCSCELR